MTGPELVSEYSRRWNAGEFFTDIAGNTWGPEGSGADYQSDPVILAYYRDGHPAKPRAFTGYMTVDPHATGTGLLGDITGVEQKLQYNVNVEQGTLTIDDPRVGERQVTSFSPHKEDEVIAFHPAQPPAQPEVFRAPVVIDWFPKKLEEPAVAPVAPHKDTIAPTAAEPPVASNFVGLSGPILRQQYQNSLSAGGVIGAVAGVDGCSALPAQYQAACRAALAIGGAVFGGGGSQAAGGALQPSCSPGYTWSNVLNKCVKLTAALPGGQPMTQTSNYPVAGGLGMAAVQPIQVGYITRNDGVQSPIMRCPKRYVLGMDYLCYPKSMIPNNLRAHPRGTRPLLTGGEVKILRRAKTLEKKVSKLSTKFGKKVCHCGPKKGRKK